MQVRIRLIERERSRRLGGEDGGEKTEADLVVSADKLQAKGIKLAKGAKVVAALTTPAAKAVTVRFTVK